MRIYLIRHGRQCDPRCNVNVPLSEEGVRQARLAGKRLQNAGIQKVYASDLIRARETAQYANESWNVEIEIDPAFREIDFGDMEGLPVDQMWVRYPEQRRLRDLMELDVRYPGGESGADLIARSMPALLRVAESGLDCAAIATHGCWIRLIVSFLLGIPLPRWQTLGHNFENGSITELVYERETQRFFLNRFNDYAHLEPYPELLRSAWCVSEK